jgi:hypothetical protein
MVNVLQPVAPPDSAAADSELPQPDSSLLTSSLLNQALIQWNKPELLAAPASTKRMEAMQRLVKRIAQLRAVENGLTNAQLLLPFVSAEAQEVLLPEPDLLPTIPSEQPSFSTHQIDRLDTLAPYLLWQVVRSTHEAMRLIEGSPAQVKLDGQSWQAGILRLVVRLQLQAESLQSIDLVTFEPATSELSDAAQIQLQTSLLGQQPITAGALLRQLSAQFAEPALEQLQLGLAAKWLIPTQTWQSGQIYLQLGLEFTPKSAVPEHLLSEATVAIKFTQPDWLEQHVTTAVEHQLIQMLRQVCPSLPRVSQTEALLTVVQQGYDVIDALQSSLTLASRTFAQQPLPVDELLLRLLWGMNRSAYELMQFASGVAVQLLQPQKYWTPGMLRYVVQLEIRTPEQTWQFDLAQRGDSSHRPALATTAVIQSDQNLWCMQPIQLSALEARLWQQIEQAAPELALLQAGTEVSIQSGEAKRQSGLMQLTTSFEFIATVSSSLQRL